MKKAGRNFRTSPGLEYTDFEGGCCDFYYAIDLITDLAALTLESKKSGGFNLEDLFDGESRELFVKIITTSEGD